MTPRSSLLPQSSLHYSYSCMWVFLDCGILYVRNTLYYPFLPHHFVQKERKHWRKMQWAWTTPSTCYLQLLWNPAGFTGGPVVKNSPANAGDQRCGFDPWVKKIPWRRKWQPTPVFLSVESQRVELDSRKPISSAICSTTPEWWLKNINILFRNLRKEYCLREGKIKLENSNKLFFSYTKSSCHFLVYYYTL